MRRVVVGVLLTATVAVSGCQTFNAVGNAISPSSTGKEVASPPSSAAPPAPAAMAASGGNDGMTGLSGDALRAAWGEPTLKRAENGAELWQYRGGTCSVLVYLYPAPSNGWRIAHAEAIPGGADAAAVAACARAGGRASLKPIS